MTNRELAQRAFDAFRRGVGGEQAGVEEFVGYLADDAVCLFPPLPHMPSRYEGPAAARGIFAGVLSRIPRGLQFEPVFVLEDGERFAFQFADRGERATAAGTATVSRSPSRCGREGAALMGVSRRVPGYYVADGVEP